MTLALGDIFALRGSRRAAALAHGHAARSPAKKRAKAALRPSALAFETYEPRMLLSADTFAGYTVASYLASPVIGAGLSAELMDAADLIDDIAQQANSAAQFGDELATEIPGLLDRSGTPFEAPTLGDVLGNAGNDFNAVKGAVVSLFNDASLTAATTPAALATALEALSDDLGDGVTLQVNLLDADPGTGGDQSYRLVTIDADSFELLYNLEVLVTLTDPDDGDTFSLDPGRNADALEVDYKAALAGGTHLPSIKLSSSYRIETVFGIAADIVYDNDLDNDTNIEENASDFGVIVTPTSAFLRDPSFEAGIFADTTTSAIPALQFGFLDIKAEAGTADFDMHVEVAFAGTIDAAGDMTSPAVTTGGDIEVILPISVDPSGVLGGGGFSGASPSIRLYSDNPFKAVHSSISGSDDGRTAISIQLQDFAKLNPFRNIDADGLANVFSGLGTMLEQLQAKAQLFGLAMPVIDSTKISDLLDFDGPMKTLYEALTVEKNGTRVAKFFSVQDFVSKLQTALNNILATYNTNPDFTDIAALVGINPRYEFLAGVPTLRFTIDLYANVSNAKDENNQSLVDLEGDLGLDLSPVGEVALTGSLELDAAFSARLTLGIELVEPPNVGVVTAISPSSLVSRVVDGNVGGSEDVEFSLVLGGVGSVRVTLANQDYGSTAALATALETAIANAITSAISAGTLAAATPGPDIDVDVNTQGRLVIASATLPYLQIINRGDAAAFGELGFLNEQRATVSRLPANGQLSGDASFALTIGATTHTVNLTAASTAGNSTPEDLVASLNTAIAAQFGAGTYAALVGEDIAGDDVVGRRIKIASGQSFIRIDAANPVAQAELGLQNDAVSSQLMIRGDGSIFYEATDPASPLPASGNAGAVSFTVTLTQGGASSGAIAVNATLSGNNVDGEGTPLTAAQAAIEAAKDLNDALASTTLTGDQKLSSVLVATPIEFRNADGTGNGKWGIRFIQPAATVDTPLAYAFADSIAIAGISGSEDIGIADGTANRSGPSLASTLSGDASFTINLSGASGTVIQQPITIDDSAITNTLAGVVDAINSAINAGGSEVAGKVVVGLEGARLVFAVTDSTVTVIELSSVNTVAQNDLGLQEGISARTFEGVQAFVEDMHLDASLAVDGSASGSANFGFVELDLGTATVELDAVVDVDITNRIYVKDLFKALGKPMDATAGLIDLIDADADDDIVGLGSGDEEIDLHGSASVDWDGLDIGVAGALDPEDNVADDLSTELGEVASPYIHVSLSDITDFDSLSVDANLGSLADLADFGFDDALAALRAIADWLLSYTEQVDILNEPLPLLGISLADTLAFVDDFAQAVEDVADNPTKTLQSLLDKVNEGLQQFVGPLAHIGYIANSPGILTFNLQFKRNFADILPLEIDMVELLENELGITVPGLELNGAANLAAEFGFEAELVFGVDVAALSTALDDPVHTADDVLDAIFLVVEDTDTNNIDGYTHLALTGYAFAENVTFIGALGPLGLFVSNGGAVLNKTGAFGDTDPAELAIELPDLGDDDGYLTLADFFDSGNLAQIFNPSNVQVDLGVAAVLPVSFPTSSNFIGNLDFTALVTDPFGAGGVTYTLNSIPDFSQIDLGSLGLLDTINLFLAGADTVLGTLGDLITGEVFGADALADLPLVGDALQDAGAFIDQIRDEVIPQITEIIETAPELLADIFADMGAIIQDALSTLSFLGSSVKLNLIDGSGNVFKTYDFDPLVSAAAGYFDNLANDIFSADGFSYTLDLGVDLHLQPNDVNLNLEVFQLEITEPITVDIAADLTFGIGVSLSDGFFFQVNPDGEADLSGSITIDLPAEIDAQLFFLQLTAVNNNTDPDLKAAFAVDVVGTDNGRVGFGDIGDLDFDVDFGAQVDLDFLFKLGVANSLGGIGLPKILADFDFAWGFGDLVLNSVQYGIDADHPETPLLSLGQVKLDIGSFLGDTIGPFISDLYEVLEPIDPILDILTDPIPVLSDLLGPTSLLDVAATFGIVNPALVTALELLDQVVDFASTVSEGNNGFITLFAGTLTFGGGGMDLTDMNQVGALTDPSKTLTLVFSELESLGLGLPGELTEVLTWIGEGFNPGELPGVPQLGGASGGFTFPFLEHFEEVMGLFFGRNMTLVAYDLPPLEFGFDFSIYVPIWDGLGARFAGGINAVIDLAFGYDTEGIFRFANGGFNPLDLVQGFFVYDDNPFGGFTGIDVPEVLITGQITAAAELNLVVASAGVGGGIFATVGFDLADPDGDFRVRLDEIIANLVNGFEKGVGPLGLFDVDALIEAKLFAYIEALFGLWRKEFQFGPSIPLYDKHYEVPHDAVLATDMENGVLRLNAGDFAQDRIYTNNGADIPVDGDEEFEIKIISTTEIQVHGRGPDFDEWGDWQTYKNDDGFDKITAFAGIGNDIIKVVQDATAGAVRVEFAGGAGDDELQGGKAADLLVGDSGADTLKGGDGGDDIQGGTGADCLEGQAGNDTATGDAGNDVIMGGAGLDLAFGDAGDDVIAGGNDADTLLGGDGADLVSGGGDADVLLGEAGNDRLWGDLDFSFTGCVLTLVGGDEPAFTVPALQGADYIAGGGGSDEIQGNGANDSIWGDSTFELDAGHALQFDGGKPLLTLPLYGNFGADNLSGGAGNDTLYGEAGNDVIRGDNLRVDNEDDDNPFTWVEGDRFSAGTAHGGTDGDDTIFAGRDSDIAYGNGGDDIIAGGTENDILFGNADDDTITGDVGADVVFGDNGTVQVWLAGDDIDAGAGSATYGAATQDFKLLLSYTDAGDGDDWIDAGQDNDIVFGGGGLGLQAAEGSIGQTIEDLIKAGSGDDIAFGDHGRIDFTYSAGAAAAYATNIESVDKAFGGDDQIFGSTGRDVLIGGEGGDFVNGDDAFNPDDPDSRDVVAGDHVKMTQVVTLVTITPNVKVADVYVAAPKKIVSSETSAAQGGDDTLDGRQDDDFLIGGPGDDSGTGGLGNDVLLGDRGQIDFDLSFIDPNDEEYVFDKGELFVLQTVQSTDLNPATDIPFTGVDEMSGGDGNDVVMGGGRGDKLFGDAELDGSVGTLTAHSDILLGDNGRVDYLQHGTLAKVRTTDTVDATGGNDTIEGNAGIDIAMGGVGGDTIYGDAAAALAADGDDILLGDNGEVDFTRDLDANLAPTGASPANLATLDLIRSYTDGLGAADTISGNAGADVAMGGTAGDFIYGDAATVAAGDGDDMLLGDNGRVELVDPALDGGPDTGTDRMLIRGGAVALIRSTDGNDAIDDTGGRDEISGNAGGDIMLGGVRGDWLWGDRSAPTAGTNTADGEDIILGDNGALEWLSTGRLSELSFSPSDPRWNAALPGAFAARDVDLDTLDLITTEQPNNGGRDIIYGGNARDTAFGGTDADTIWGDTGLDGLFSLGSVDSATNGNDLLFGDHGRLYTQLSVLANIYSRNFFAIDIEQADGGEGDRIWGEEGMDILLGQQGDDRLWGGSEDDDLIGGHNVEGGADELVTTTISVATGANLWNDLMDGGSENDVLSGDNAIVWRTGDEISPRFRMLTGATLYTTTESTVSVNVDGTPRQDPDDTRGRFVFLLDHADDTAAGLFGRDVMAGGGHRDTMFGQLGDDLMQGDGMIDGTVPGGGVSVTLAVLDTVGAAPGETGGTLYFRVPEQTSDGDDYMEGNGGGDYMLGGLGQDDMIGGSSALYGLTTPEKRPDGSDYMWGGAGIQTARGDLGYLMTSLSGADPANTPAETVVAAERGRDADHMLGDNANIFRIVTLVNAAVPGGETNYVRYQYDNAGYTGSNPLVVRASQWLDYTLGGPDFDQDGSQEGVQTTQGDDNGAGDFMHGEAGNDHVHGMAGSDILFGDAHDDDIIGGYGHDWVSGGTGQDGVIGDDGIIRTSRNSTSGETLYGVAGLLANDPNPKDINGNALDETISTPGSIQVAFINKAGELAKAMDLTPLSVDAIWGAIDDEFGYAGQSSQDDAPFADDVIYGGTGSDWLHGGSGDDGISGAEALAYFYTRAMLGTPGAATLGGSSVNVGDQLRFNPEDADGSGPNRQRAGEFALYDEYFPLDEIRVADADGWGAAADRVRPVTAAGAVNPAFATATPFFLNFDANDGVVRASESVPTTGNNTISTGSVNDDGDDRIFGDTGNDWLVGGTGRDDVYGGWGNDLMNVDDRHTTHDSLNDQPDTHSTYEDRAYGGAGRDVLIGNTGGDRLIDWVGEWNSYLVPFAPFGMATVSRTLQPQLPEFLYALSRADGADPTIVADGNGAAERNGEPFGELALVLQKDTAWQDQTGAPADPQAGNIPGGKRDVLRSADFNNQQGQGFVPESGSWKITAGKYEVAPSPTSTNKDAISLYFTGEPLPLYFELAATINAIKPTAGFKANAYIIFDYVSPTDFKFAGLNVSTNKIEIGQRAGSGFQTLASINAQLKAGQDYNVLLAVNGNAVTFVVNGTQSVSYAFAPRVDALGTSHPIRDGMFGLGGDNARARIDDVRLQILPPNYSYVVADDFPQAGGLLAPVTGSWATGGGRLVGTPAAGSVAIAENPIAVGANSVLQVDAVFSLSSASSIGGIVFDKYSETDFKFVAISAVTKQILIGHYTERSGWVVDSALSRPEFTTGVDYSLGVSLKGSTVSVTLGGSAVFSRSYNSTVVDGAVGVLARGGAVSFDSFGLKTDDPQIGSTATTATLAAQTDAAALRTADGGTTLDSATMTLALSGDTAAALFEEKPATTASPSGYSAPWWHTLAGSTANNAAGQEQDAMQLAASEPVASDDGSSSIDPVTVRRGAADTAESGPAIDWSTWDDGVTADRTLVLATGDVLWQEQFVSRMGARSGPGGLNSSLYFQL